MDNKYDKIPRVSPLWRARNDGKYIVAYRCSATDPLLHKILSPYEAAIIPFLSGSFCVEEIKQAFLRIHDPNDKRTDLWSRAFDISYAALEQVDGLITYSGPVSPSLEVRSRHLLCNLSEYSKPISRLNRPLSIYLAVKSTCTLACRYCYQERRPCNEADLQQWCNLFDELVRNEIFIVEFGGTEIFARRDALEIIKEMATRSFTFSISTKSYLSPNVCKQLAENNVGLVKTKELVHRPVQVSIDTLNEDVADYLTVSKNYVKRAEETVKNLLAVGIIPRIKCVLTPFNMFAPKKLVEHFATLGVNSYQFAFYGRSHYRHSDSLFLSYEQKKAITASIVKIQQSHPELTISFPASLYSGGPRNMTWDTWHSRNTCPAGRTTIVIQANGDVTMCEQIPHSTEHIVGNVFKTGLLEVWNSDALISYAFPKRNDFIGTICFDCKEFEECYIKKGACFREALFAYDTIRDAPPECPKQTKQPPRNI